MLQELGTRVVVPFLPPHKAPKPAKGLNPVFAFEGLPWVMMTQYLAAVPDRELKKVVASLAIHQDDITRALDLLLTGF
ncbi:plasmid maintenance protein CcdB [Gluconacetobacter aggeris]|uniref:Toxin CcdB n=1 Tax=Gluconacetobacter aggeris TaxID=1286186 RepID=A0A7W4NYY1_9PROT|nr:CcdB family protein [Gluconacetobacter aggeris]MBB2169033.1 plasmid maintenance protein CcdB [Gluconacetobacter aggeris]